MSKPEPSSRQCQHCHGAFYPSRSDQVFDTPACRKAAHRASKAAAVLAEVEQERAEARAAAGPNATVASATGTRSSVRPVGPTYPSEVQFIGPPIGKPSRRGLRLPAPIPANPAWDAIEAARVAG